MIQGLIAGSTIGVLEQVAAFSEARHGLLAGNIANLDTPGYKTRDLSVEAFQQRLRDAIAAQRSPGQASSGASGSYGQIMAAGEEGLDPMRDVKETMKSILYHDQSDVGLEQQVTELANNQFTHDMAISLMTHQFRQLSTAISERV